MTTACNTGSVLFQGLGRREVVARFDGGTITSDAGALLLRETERITGIVRQFAACVIDRRRLKLVEWTCSPIAPVPPRCGPMNSVCGSPRWPMY